jgi:hypothetical protein
MLFFTTFAAAEWDEKAGEFARVVVEAGEYRR